MKLSGIENLVRSRLIEGEATLRAILDEARNPNDIGAYYVGNR